MKRRLRIAGWALGLSLAMAGIGAAVGASQGAPVEAGADAGGTPTGDWEPITAVSEIVAGTDYLLGYVDSDTSYFTKSSSLAGSGGTQGGWATSGDLTEAKLVRFASVANGWNILLTDSKKVGYKGSGTDLVTSTADKSSDALYVWAPVAHESGDIYFTTNSGARFLGASSTGAAVNIKAYAVSTGLDTYPRVTAYKQSKAISSIDVTHQPTKTEYKIGEAFDATGLQVTITYSDETTSVVSYSPQNASKFAFTGFDSSSAATNQQVTVKYTPKSEQFTCATKAVVDIIEVNPDVITIDASSVKVAYDVGDVLDLSGLAITIHYDNDDEEVVNISNTADFVAKGFSLKMDGNAFDPATALTAAHNGKSFVVWFGNLHDDSNAIEISTVVRPVYSLVKSASQLVYGGTYTIAVASKGVAVGAFSSENNYFGKVDVVVNDESFKEVEGLQTFKLGAANGGYALYTDGLYVSTTVAKKLYMDNTHVSADGCAVTINEDETNGYSLTFGDVGTILYNVNNPRFLNYTSAPTVAMIEARLYQLQDEEVTCGAKTWATAFNTEIDSICATPGAIKTAWDSLGSKADYAALDDFSKDVLAYGIAKPAAEGGDAIEEALACYDFCVANYDLTKFVEDSATEPTPNKRANFVAPTLGVIRATDPTAIAVAGLIGGMLLATGVGVLVIRRKKQK